MHFALLLNKCWIFTPRLKFPSPQTFMNTVPAGYSHWDIIHKMALLAFFSVMHKSGAQLLWVQNCAKHIFTVENKMIHTRKHMR